MQYNCWEGEWVDNDRANSTLRNRASFAVVVIVGFCLRLCVIDVYPNCVSQTTNEMGACTKTTKDRKIKSVCFFLAHLLGSVLKRSSCECFKAF